MAGYTQIEDLGVVQINTTDDFIAVDPGLAGVAYLQAAAKESLQSYTNLDAVERDYPIGTYLYSAASAYFNNAESPLFQVLNYPSNVSSTLSATTSSTTGSVTGSSAGSSAGSSSANTASGSTSPVINVPAQSDADSAVATVKKYYSAAWEHLVIHVTPNNHNVAIQVSQFMEAQNNKLLYLEIPAAAPADGSGPDFSWLKPLQPSDDNHGVLSTVAQSLPESTDSDNDFNLTGAFLSEYANANVGTNPQFITGLEKFANVKPQDFYNFVKEDLDKYYTPYNVWTYEYRNGVPMFSTNYSIAGYQFQIMLVRDAIIADVKKAVVNLFLQNGGVPFTTAGVNSILDQVQMVLDKYSKLGLITNAKVDNIDVDKITDAIKAIGKLSGIGWTWTPVFGVNKAVFHQGIELPELS